jgi:hypothetical protein
LVYSGQRPEGIEEGCIGSQRTHRTVVLEEEGKEKKMKVAVVVVMMEEEEEEKEMKFSSCNFLHQRHARRSIGFLVHVIFTWNVSNKVNTHVTARLVLRYSVL